MPAVLAGVVLMLWWTGTTLNIQSAMGAIMAVGVAVANAILLVTFAERSRIQSGDALAAALEGGRSRLRPILMTSFAMIAGMTPLALGLGEGGDQTAPLGRAVVGGRRCSCCRPFSPSSDAAPARVPARSIRTIRSAVILSHPLVTTSLCSPRRLP